jgi:hypothetical protein
MKMKDQVLILVKLMKMVNVLYVNVHYVFVKNVKKKSNVKLKMNEENYKMIQKNLKKNEIKSLEHF